jgi:archaellum component FlaC
MMMIDVDPKIKKKKGADYFQRPEDLDDEWVKQHQDALVEEQRQKITKKFEKDNEKLKAEGQKGMKEKELKERLQVADDLAAKFKKENKTGKVEAEGKGPTIEKLTANIEKLEQRIETMKIQMEDKEGNKEVALGTSKIVSGVLLEKQIQSADGARDRTISTPVSLWSSRRSSMSRSSDSSPRRCARNSTGPSSPWMRTGSSKRCNIMTVFGFLLSEHGMVSVLRGDFASTAA